MASRSREQGFRVTTTQPYSTAPIPERPLLFDEMMDLGAKA